MHPKDGEDAIAGTRAAASKRGGGRFSVNKRWGVRCFVGAVLVGVVAFAASSCTSSSHFRQSNPKAAKGGNLPHQEEVAPETWVHYVEFDGKGDAHDSDQLESAIRKIADLRKACYENGSRLVVVGYVHGWRNNSVSGDAAKFRSLVRHLGRAGVKDGRYRVIGVYFAWPGAPFGDQVKRMAEPDACLASLAHFYSPILSALEVPTVWNRWGTAVNVAKNHSPNGFTDAISQIGRAVHLPPGKSNKAPKFVLFAHSMGGLITELAVLPKMFAPDEKERRPDLVFTLNSSSPALLAKRALASVAEMPGEKPRVVAVTSRADCATRVINRIAYWFAPTRSAIEPEPRPDEKPYLYRTGGHQDDLATHRLARTGKKDKDLGGDLSKFLISTNLKLDDESVIPDSNEVVAFNDKKNQTGAGMASYWEYRANSTGGKTGPLWMVQTQGEMIRDHGDIWDTQAVSLMLAAIRISGILEHK